MKYSPKINLIDKFNQIKKSGKNHIYGDHEHGGKYSLMYDMITKMYTLNIEDGIPSREPIVKLRMLYRKAPNGRWNGEGIKTKGLERTYIMHIMNSEGITEVFKEYTISDE